MEDPTAREALLQNLKRKRDSALAHLSDCSDEKKKSRMVRVRARSASRDTSRRPSYHGTVRFSRRGRPRLELRTAQTGHLAAGLLSKAPVTHQGRAHLARAKFSPLLHTHTPVSLAG